MVGELKANKELMLGIIDIKQSKTEFATSVMRSCNSEREVLVISCNILALDCVDEPYSVCLFLGELESEGVGEGELT